MTTHPLLERPLDGDSHDFQTAKRIETAFRSPKSPRHVIRTTLMRPIGPETGAATFRDSICYSEFEAMIFFGRVQEPAKIAPALIPWIREQLRSHLPDRTTPFGHTEPLARACRRIHARLQEHGLTCSLFYGLLDARRRRLDYYSAGVDGRASLLRTGSWIALEQTSHILGGHVEGMGRFQSVSLDSEPFFFLTSAIPPIGVQPHEHDLSAGASQPQATPASPLARQVDRIAVLLAPHQTAQGTPVDPFVWGVEFDDDVDMTKDLIVQNCELGLANFAASFTESSSLYYG